MQAASWHDIYNRFRAGVKDLEVMMQNIINSAFETVKNVQQGVEVLHGFVRLSSREVSDAMSDIISYYHFQAMGRNRGFSIDYYSR